MDDRPWGGPSPPAVAYVFADGRGTEEIAGQLTGFDGMLQVDGYAAYNSLARDHGGAIRLAFCLAHARRNFVEVHKTTQSPFAHEVIERLQAVYAIEAEIRGSPAEQRLAVRRAKTTPLMEALKARLTSMHGQLFSQSTLTGAIDYAINHWDGLTLFLNDGRVEVDTNTVERSIRPIAMGRRIHCSAATRAAPRAGPSCLRWSTRQNSTNSIRRPIWPTCWSASSPGEPRAISCTSFWPGTGRRPARAAYSRPHEPARPSRIVSAGRHAARRTRSMAGAAGRSASRCHQHPDARRLRYRDRGRTGVDQPA